MTSGLPVVGLASSEETKAPYALAGQLLTSDECRRGWIAIEGGTIRDVSFDMSTLPAGAIDLGEALVCPAFVDLHNHVIYNAYERWRPQGVLGGRFDWRGRTRCAITVNPHHDSHYKKNVSAPHKAITRPDGKNDDLGRLGLLCTYGQIRGLIGGATTMVIDADLDPDRASAYAAAGFVRDSDEWKIRVYGVLDVTCLPLTSSQEIKPPNHPIHGADRIAAELQKDAAKLLVHVGEGSDSFSVNEFYALVDRNLLTRNTALIHAFALDHHRPRAGEKAAWDQVADAGAHVVLSPVSNLTLYKRTINIAKLVDRKIPISLSPDWSITGSSSMLDELRFVARRDRLRSPDEWLRSCTEVPAGFLGLPLGRIQSGYAADLLVFRHNDKVRDDREVMAHVIAAAMHDDLVLAVSNGQALYGEPDLLSKFPSQLAAETLQVPMSTGRVEPRAIRIGKTPVVDALISQLTALFKENKINLAPLWDDWIPTL